MRRLSIQRDTIDLFIRDTLQKIPPTHKKDVKLHHKNIPKLSDNTTTKPEIRHSPTNPINQSKHMKTTKKWYHDNKTKKNNTKSCYKCYKKS